MTTATIPRVTKTPVTTETAVPDFAGQPDKALRWLERKAKEQGMDDEAFRSIRDIGECDLQVGQRIAALCQYLEMDPSRFGV